MRLQVLMSAMNLNGVEIISDANIQSDAIIINQCDEFSKNTIFKDGNKIDILSFDERGVGLSRNNALMRADAEIVLFSDEDMHYVDGYESIILNEFSLHPDADMIVFNVISSNPDRPLSQIKNFHRINWTNSLRHGAVKYAVRLKSVREKNITFSLMFGGGAKYMSGEDSLFIHDCLKNKFKIYGSPKLIGHVKQNDSTWFKGYDLEYLYHRGALYCALYGKKLSRLMVIIFILRKQRILSDAGGIWEQIRYALKGSNDYSA